MTDHDEIQEAGVSAFNGLITSALEGRILVDQNLKPSLFAVFKNNATEICALRKLGWTSVHLVELLKRAGYEPSAITVQKYASRVVEFADPVRVEQLAKAAMMSKRARATVAPAPLELEEPTSASPSPPGKTAEKPARERRLGHDASETLSHRDTPAPAGQSGKDLTARVPLLISNGPLVSLAADIQPAAASVIVSAEIERQSADMTEIDGVSRSFSEFRAAVEKSKKANTAMVRFEDGKDMFVETRLHQKIVAGTIGSWDQFYKQ